MQLFMQLILIMLPVFSLAIPVEDILQFIKIGMVKPLLNSADLP